MGWDIFAWAFAPSTAVRARLPPRISEFDLARPTSFVPRSVERETRSLENTSLCALLGTLPVRRTISGLLPNSSPVAVLGALLGVLALAVYKRRKFLFAKDPNVAAPLPDGTYGGCPLLGNDFMSRDKATGLSAFVSRASKKLGNPGVFKYLAFGRPMAVVSGSENARKVLGSEFQKGGVRATGTLKNSEILFGKHNLLMSDENDEHNYLRRLVGQSMTPEAITLAIPTLQKVVLDQLAPLIKSPRAPISMEQICTDFTLDVAHTQILGLNLQDSEIPDFRVQVAEWINGSVSPRNLLLPFVKLSKAYKARVWLVDKIETQIEELRANGPDGSTLSSMVFATDDEEGQRELTQEEIIDNALILILAGSETSASTLTNTVLFLGRSPEIYKKVQDEQKDLVAKHGESLTRQILDKDCPFLEAVIKEAMRIRPINSGAIRVPTDTMVIDGKQIPKGWPVTVNIQLTHEHDPTVYEEDGSHMDVEKGFRPKRWLDSSTRPAAEFMAFGWGPRYCLGATLAMAEMKMFLAIFAREIAKFDLVNNKDIVEWKRMSIIPKPNDGTIISAVSVNSPSKKTTASVDIVA